MSSPSSLREKILTPQAVEFLEKLHRKFNSKRLALLERRQQIQKQIDRGQNPDFLAETQSTRDDEWKVAPIPRELLDRRVEITGPVDRKMVINALNSGAKVFMADFEDAHSPTWAGTLEGQANLQDAVRRVIEYRSPEGKKYALNKNTAILMMRPRGLHLEEKNLVIDGRTTSGSLFDFGLYLFHNAQELLARGTGPYFYLPKLENHREARWWAEVFAFSEGELGLSKGTIRATVLIETILAAFEMDEILYELRDWALGLNCGRWDYIFSFIKKFRNRPEFLFPDRAQITMSVHFLDAYCRRLIQTCHKRGAHAMGGMAAEIPNKSNPELNRRAMEKVRQDKEREVRLGHDGTWVSHPGMVPIAMEVFDGRTTPPTIGSPVRSGDLLAVPKGDIPEEGLRLNVNLSFHYLEAWLSGSGCVPLYGLMEDAATAEISRAQIWHWIRHPEAKTSDGKKITLSRVLEMLEQEFGKTSATLSAKRAHDLLIQIFSEDDFTDFMTLVAYPFLP